jgi:MFS family permease
LRTFRALENPKFRSVWSGMLISQTGAWMQSTALSFLVFQLTGSALQTSLVMFFTTLPTLLFSVFGGAIADRADPRRIVIAMQTLFMANAFLLAALTFSGAIRVWQIYAVAFTNGVAFAFDSPSRQAMLPLLIERRDIRNAIALNAAAFNGSRMIGPAIAGLIYRSIGPAWCFLANGVSFLGMLVPLSRLRLDRPADREAMPVLAQITGGLGYVRSHTMVRPLLELVAIFGIFAFPWGVLMPAFTVKVLGLGAAENGLLYGAYGAGSTLGALVVASLQRVRRPGRVIFGLVVVSAAVLAASALPRSLPAAMAGIGVTGFFLVATMSSTNGFIQSQVDDAYRGRVMSLHTMATMGTGPIGSVIAGALADRYGVPASIALNGALLFLFSVVQFFRARTVVRHDERARARDR